MARPIKDTPIIYGEEANLFEEKMAKMGRATKSEIEEAKRIYDKIRSISTFQM